MNSGHNLHTKQLYPRCGSPFPRQKGPVSCNAIFQCTVWERSTLRVLSHLFSLCFYSPSCPSLSQFSTLDLPQDPATHLLNVKFPLLLENKRNFSPRPSSLIEPRLLFNLTSQQARHTHYAEATFISFPFPECPIPTMGMSFPQFSPCFCHASDHRPNITSSR